MKQVIAWESRCRRCGRCCYEKYQTDDGIFYTDTPCEYLDLGSCLCTVYDHRHRVKNGCVAITGEIAALGVLPADCPYVTDIPDYVPPILFGQDDSTG